MIAIFCFRQRDFDDLRCTPEKNFVRIRNVQSIRGRNFTGIITMYDWYENKNLRDAYDELMKRQPELFK